VGSAKTLQFQQAVSREHSGTRIEPQQCKGWEVSSCCLSLEAAWGAWGLAVWPLGAGSSGRASLSPQGNMGALATGTAMTPAQCLRCLLGMPQAAVNTQPFAPSHRRTGDTRPGLGLSSVHRAILTQTSDLSKGELWSAPIFFVLCFEMGVLLYCPGESGTIAQEILLPQPQPPK
jgi:hypothetical protein